MTTEELFDKEFLKERLFHDGDFIGVFYNVADALLKSDKLDYWHAQTNYQTDHRILNKVSFESHFNAKLHLEIAPVNLLTFNGEIDGIAVTLYNDVHDWDIHKQILELCRCSNLHMPYYNPFAVQFEINKDKTTRILYKVIIPTDIASHGTILKMLTVIKLVIAAVFNAIVDGDIEVLEKLDKELMTGEECLVLNEEDIKLKWPWEEVIKDGCDEYMKRKH